MPNILVFSLVYFLYRVLNVELRLGSCWLVVIIGTFDRPFNILLLVGHNRVTSHEVVSQWASFRIVHSSGCRSLLLNLPINWLWTILFAHWIEAVNLRQTGHSWFHWLRLFLSPSVIFLKSNLVDWFLERLLISTLFIWSNCKLIIVELFFDLNGCLWATLFIILLIWTHNFLIRKLVLVLIAVLSYVSSLTRRQSFSSKLIFALLMLWIMTIINLMLLFKELVWLETNDWHLSLSVHLFLL